VRFRPLKLTPESRSRARARGTALAAPAALLLALLALFTATPALSRPSGEDFWVVNGQVLVTKLAGTTLYIAGEFSRISPRNRGAVPFDVQTGLPVAGFPHVKGTVHALIPDGFGGWYIGGSFRTVGGKQCTNIAHVLPDMTVADWNVGFEQAVLSLAVDGDVLYMTQGGALDAATRTRLEIYDVSGRRVAKLADDEPEPGEHEFTWDTRGAATRAGVYFAALDVAGVRTSRKLVVL
jgi:hypothetical protein